jgi:23S rRNA (pseudouridine1915-N3)-methyltransferase
MKILLLQIGKTRDSYIGEGVAEYSSRVRRYLTYEEVSISMPKTTSGTATSRLKKAEADALLTRIVQGDYLVLLDEEGENPGSEGFAAFLAKRMNSSVKRMVFAIGGAYGFDESVLLRADYRLSLSRMTFTHQMVRLIFIEQLYRALTILKGEKYHHG